MKTDAPLTWREWFEQHGLTEMCDFAENVWNQSWKPTAADRKAAWELYTEMRTRISTQPLPYRSGDESTALESIYRLFKITRDTISTNGPECRHFATITVDVLNFKIRSFTARWHKLAEAGILDAEDGRHSFRGALQELQETLSLFLQFLGRLSEGDAFVEGSASGGTSTVSEKEIVGESIPYDCLLGLSDQEDLAESILTAERGEIFARRKAHGFASETDNEKIDDLVGMAISGGGIRSATFALGVLQGIAAKNLLKDVDLLSTVSGGGYIGSFISSYLNDADSPEKSRKDIGLDRDQLPFSRDQRCESMALRFLRNNSKYLLPRGFLSRLTMIGQGLYGVFMNLVILFPLLMTAVLLTQLTERIPEKWGNNLFHRMQIVSGHVSRSAGIDVQWKDFWLTLIALGLLLFVLFLLPLAQKISRFSSNFILWRKRYEFLCVLAFAGTILIGIIQLIPLGYYGFLRLNQALGLIGTDQKFEFATLWVILGNVVTFLSARGVLWRARQTDAAEKQRVSVLRKLAFLILWLSGPVLMVMLYFGCCHIFLLKPSSVPAVHFLLKDTAIETWLALLIIIPFAYSFGFLNVNVISPHRYYRNRLAETYLLRPDGPTGEGVQAVDPQLLSDMGKTRKGPYHLINASLNLPSSRVPDLRGRDSDFFLFSKHYCGSPIVGYFPTKWWEHVDGHLNLGTAVAISAAAASPHMGASTPRGASFFLTLLNVRLGYWLRRPDIGILPAWQSKPARSSADEPVSEKELDRLQRHIIRTLGGPGPTYLMRELFGQVDEDARYLNLSDGGHIENLAVYELLRRRCKFIVAIDGECDPSYEFPSLMRLQQFAWIDFGTEIHMDVNLLRVNTTRFSQVHFSMGRILYPDGAVGFILYVKLSVSGNEKDYILDYCNRNPPFPHQSTADQLFDESQFEAYRALGEHVTEDLFSPPLCASGAEPPQSVHDWFTTLARHLLTG